jgi:hypothetical protein
MPAATMQLGQGSAGAGAVAAPERLECGIQRV